MEHKMASRKKEKNLTPLRNDRADTRLTKKVPRSTFPAHSTEAKREGPSLAWPWPPN